jgi:hypothetical protein
MGLLDKLKGKTAKLKETAADHADQIEGGIDKGADLIDDKTGGKYSEKIDAAADKAKDAVKKLDD